MKTTTIQSLALVLVSGLVGVALTYILVTAFFTTINTATGATIQGNDYNSQSLLTASASNTAAVVLKDQGGSFGTLIVLQPAATVVRVYDHPSATATIPTYTRTGARSTSPGASVSSSTLVVTIPANLATGTYPFDVDMKTGLVLDVPSGFTGNYVVTYR